jgi:hypothetical protein
VEGETAFWTKIGAARAHDHGEGFDLQLSALPLTGRPVIRRSSGSGPMEPPSPPRIIHSYCIKLMRRLPTASADFILADAPYLVRYRDRGGRTVANHEHGC